MEVDPVNLAFSWLNGKVFVRPLLVASLLSILPSYGDAYEECLGYTNASGTVFPPKLCDPYCCGSATYRYCCNNCSLSISKNDTCSDTDEWDPTSTIIQGVFIGLWFIIILTVWGLQSNGCLDTGKCPKKRRRPMGRFRVFSVTSTIIQCVFIGLFLIGMVVVVILGLMGKCDDPETIRMRNERRPLVIHTIQTQVLTGDHDAVNGLDDDQSEGQGPTPTKSFEGAYPKQIPESVSYPTTSGADPQSMQLAEQNSNKASLPFSPTHSEAGSDPEETTSMHQGLIINQGSDLILDSDTPAVLPITSSPSEQGGPLIHDPDTFNEDALHSVEVHSEPNPRKDYGSTEQIIPLSNRELGGYEQNNEAFVDTPVHVPKYPGRLPPIEQNRTQTPSSVILAVQPSPDSLASFSHENIT